MCLAVVDTRQSVVRGLISRLVIIWHVVGGAELMIDVGE